MNTLKKLQDVYRKFQFILSKQHKRYAVIVYLMGIIAALLELLGVAIIIPILNMMLDMQGTRKKWYIRIFADLFNLNTDLKIVWFICGMTIMVYLIKNLFFSLYSWVSLKFSAKVQRELASRVMRAYMKQGYIFFVQNNTARLLQGFTSDIGGVYQILNLFFNMITKIFTIICIGIYIMIQSKQMAVVLIALSVISFLLVQLIFRKSMQKNGLLVRQYNYECSQTAIEAMQGNKEILVMNKQNFFVDHYVHMLAKANRISVKVSIATILPAYIIEMICIGGVLMAVAIQMSFTTDTYSLIAQLSAIAVGAFRILPALGALTSGVNSITAYIPQLAAAYKTLSDVKELEEADKGNAGNSDISHVFSKSLEIENVFFRYPNSEENVLENVNLSIFKGQSIALIGPSGAGKTTLADIILSLLKPAQGCIKLDGIDIDDLGGEWNNLIGYVPQSLYIIDDSIRRNIAFGEDPKKIDDGKIWEALKIAQLDDFVRKLPNGINEQVGEWGVRFSGGQRQRLAIARALYRNPQILILDEATAALDNETEASVMQAIEALQGYKTLIIVAHRLTTVRKCDVIYEVKDRKVLKRSKEDVFSDIRSV